MSNASPESSDLFRKICGVYDALCLRFPKTLRPVETPVLSITPLRGRRCRVGPGCSRSGSDLHASPEFLNVPAWVLAFDPADAAAFLLHEMVHAAHARAGVRDARSGYHNARFRSLAERVGLDVSWTSRHYGWASTLPSEALLDDLASLPFLTDPPASLGVAVAPRRSSSRPRRRLRAWRCSCSQRVYSRDKVRAVCPVCREAFAPALTASETR